MNPPIDSIQYLIDVFIEGGYAEDDEDCRHLDEIHAWLQWQKDKNGCICACKPSDGSFHSIFCIIRNNGSPRD